MEWESPPISRVLSWTAIPLGPALLPGSSHLPAGSASNVTACLFGVAPDGGCRVSRPPGCPGLLVSVALFLASRRPAVSRHPALWSPDFPLLPGGSSGCLANFPATIMPHLGRLISSGPTTPIAPTADHAAWRMPTARGRCPAGPAPYPSAYPKDRPGWPGKPPPRRRWPRPPPTR